MNPRPSFRSQVWFGANDYHGFLSRSWMTSDGWPEDVFDGRPVIGICNTWSELTPCNSHFRELAEAVKRGVWEAGGFPVEFPVMSLGETNIRPTAMMYRNLASMDVEESIRANPIDAVVLLMGCDKTTPSLLMGAASCDLPTIGLSGGPKLSGHFRGELLGSGTGVWQLSEDLRAGTIDESEFRAAESCMNRSKGHCMTMGTASTMACVVEALGISLPHNAAIPAPDARRTKLAHLTGRRIVAMAHEDLRMSRVITRASFENAIRVNAAIGGSTNAVIHLLALAGRMGIELDLADFDRLGANVPCLLDLQPAGSYLMEDFYYAGGLPAVLAELDQAGLLSREAMTVTGASLAENVQGAQRWGTDVIRTVAEPKQAEAGIAVLYGNLAPDGAVIKPSAATPHLLRHRGRAVVFDGIEDFYARIDDEDLDIDADCVMVLRGCGPCGYPGMPEVGNMQLPKKLLRAGVTDMVRISDARMSGTAFGTVVLHVAPESAVGGPLALVRSGDVIALDVARRTLTLEVPADELAARGGQFVPPLPARGYERLYVEHVMQADKGADFDFLVGGSGATVPKPSH